MLSDHQPADGSASHLDGPGPEADGLRPDAAAGGPAPERTGTGPEAGAPEAGVPESPTSATGADALLPEADVVSPGVHSPTPEADAAELATLASELDAVDAALVRLDNDTFDRCEVCGSEIGHDRLVADPLLTRCPAHSA